MTTYTTIPDTDIDPDKPIKSSTAYAFRDNLLAVIEGDAAAPKITSRTISPGGSQADGACTNATSFPGPGFFDFSTLTITAPKTLPFASFIRVDGNATISSTLTAKRTFASEATELGILAGIGGVAPESSATFPGPGGPASGGGGGVAGDGGDAGGSGTGIGIDALIPDLANTVRLWAARRALVGGNSGSASSTSGVAGGGFIFLVVNGDLDLTGGTIDASGYNGNAGGSAATGGGGGGCIIVVCTGTITGGTYDASGGDGGSSGGDGGGGGGGHVHLIATAFAGTRTKTVTGGAGGVSNGSPGSSGLAIESTLTAGQINALLLGAQ